MKVIFGEGQRPISHLIRLRTGGRQTHCGVLIGNKVIEARGIPLGEWLKHIFLGTPYTSKHGVMETPLEEFKSKYKHTTVRYMQGDESKALELIGKPFDMAALIGSFFRINYHNPNKYMCAEVVAHCMPTVEKDQEQHFTPLSLYRFSRKLKRSEM